jgi:hypothetical protein
MRKIMLVALGLPKTAKLKDAALIHPTIPRGGYIEDPETGGQLLRPDWRVSFSDNSSWHLQMIKYMRQGFRNGRRGYLS